MHIARSSSHLDGRCGVTEALGVTISIPNHSEVKKETLKSIVRAAGYTDKEYRKAFDKT